MVYRSHKIKNIPPFEPSCRKTVYYSLEEAQDMINHINETRVVKAIRAYKCTICGFWHLTSKANP